MNLNQNGLGTLEKSVFGVSGDIYQGKLLESIRLRKSEYWKLDKKVNG